LRDIVWGILLITLSVTAMIIYFWALFLAPDIKLWKFTISEWALIIPVLIFVYLFLFVLAWIGWAMATTPPELPASQTLPEEPDKSRESDKRGDLNNILSVC